MQVLLTSYFIIIIVILLIQFQQDVNGLRYNFKLKAKKYHQAIIVRINRTLTKEPLALTRHMIKHKEIEELNKIRIKKVVEVEKEELESGRGDY